jgi:predicted nucleic acid-binding protein
VRFWDSSALVPLCLRQPRTADSRRLLKEDADMVVWWGSSIECASAIARLQRDGHLTLGDDRDARSALTALSASWYEVQPGEALRDNALRLLRLHPLRAADALQLAAAIEWAGGSSHGEFVAFDDRLREAALREGFETP